jgi:hypothetical protein
MGAAPTRTSVVREGGHGIEGKWWTPNQIGRVGLDRHDMS